MTSLRALRAAVGVLTILGFGLASGGGCAAGSADVCAALDDANAACGDGLGAAPKDCEANLGSCSSGELQQWDDRFSCLATECRDGKDLTHADTACSGMLEGVSFGCNPSGGGI
jgi:hypothetical protein